jgi:hypothetical protein
MITPGIADDMKGNPPSDRLIAYRNPPLIILEVKEILC